uniref:Uncharacterized protein n=1 Tax=Anguilla anguilla TaxID=7936 RepID=A0A0E9S0P7_ANGAN
MRRGDSGHSYNWIMGCHAFLL